MSALERIAALRAQAEAAVAGATDTAALVALAVPAMLVAVTRQARRWPQSAYPTT